MSSFVAEVRYALRSLNKSRTYAAAFVITLGLGIGVNTAIFSVINGVLLKPLPYQDADRIMFVQQPANRAGAFDAAFSFIEIDDYRAVARTIAEFVEFGDWDFSVIGRGDPHRVVGGLVTANYFEVLGILPLYGRTLLTSDDDAGARFRLVWQRAVRLEETREALLSTVPRIQEGIHGSTSFLAKSAWEARSASVAR